MTRKAKYGVSFAALAFAFGAGVVWLSVPPGLPGFIHAEKSEFVSQFLAGGGKFPPSVTETFNVHCTLEELEADFDRSGIEWKASPTRGAEGMAYRAPDGVGRISMIGLIRGRQHGGKSFYYFDHQVPSDYADGWTVVNISYRPTLKAKVRKLGEETIPSWFGKKPKPIKVFYVTIGMVPKRIP